MADTTGATPQPTEATPPQSGEKKTAGNLSGAQLAQRFMKTEGERRAAATTAEQTAPTAPTQPATEAVPTVPADPKAKPAGPAPAESADPAEGDDALSHETSLDPKLQAKIDRRIGKLTARAKAAEEAVNQLRVQMAEQATRTVTPQQPAAPVQSDIPLAHINDAQGLIQLRDDAKKSIHWAEEQLDREDIAAGVQVGNQVLTRADLRAIIRNARTTLEDQIPARLQFLQTRNQSQQAAYERYPFLKDKAAPEYLMAQQAMQTNPWLQNHPQRDELVGRYIMGLKYEQLLAEQAAKSKETPPPKPPPALKPAGDQVAESGDPSPVRAPIGTGQGQQLKALNEKFAGKRGVSAKDYAALLAQREQLKQR